MRSYLAFGDESRYNTGRYRAVSLVTLPRELYTSFSKDISAVLSDSDLSEFAWKDINSARYRFGAKKLIDLVADWTANEQLRVDTLIWDIEDSRHAHQGREDIKNFVRMYYHLCDNVWGRRWEAGGWTFHPDQHDAVSWEEDLGDYFPRVDGQLRETTDRSYWLSAIEEQSAQDEPIIQIADLFAGMAADSYGKYEKFHHWEGQTSLRHFEGEGGPELEFSNSEEERFTVLKHFLSKTNPREIIFDDYHGLRTVDTDCPVNFWPYRPQHEEDLAPGIDEE